MQVQRVQNNNYSNLPYFKGKITLLNSRIIPRSLKIKEIQVSQEADEILYDAFIKATGMNYYGVGCGLGNKEVTPKTTPFIIPFKFINLTSNPFYLRL